MTPPTRFLVPAELGDRERHLFVPAIMGAGLLFSIATVVRDVLHSRQGRAPGLDRRLDVAGRASAHHVATGESPASGLGMAARPRVFYLLTAMAALGFAAYVVVGSSYNYLREAGYVAGVAWLWGVAVLLGALLSVIGLLSLRMFVSWPAPSRGVIRLLVNTPLGRSTASAVEAELPRMLLAWATALAAGATGIVVLMAIRPPQFMVSADAEVTSTLAGWEWLSYLPLDWIGRTEPALVLAVLIGVSTMRCRVFALAYIGAFLGGWTTYVILKNVINQPRPAITGWVGVDSFPSGHLVQATIIAGLVPLALAVLLRRRWPAYFVAPWLALAVVATAMYRIHAGTHWLSDAVAGILVGSTFVLAAYWSLHHRQWHRRCHHCPWLTPISAARARPEPNGAAAPRR
jgi:membrane-associated phospholipid phosphatase